MSGGGFGSWFEIIICSIVLILFVLRCFFSVVKFGLKCRLKLMNIGMLVFSIFVR